MPFVKCITFFETGRQEKCFWIDFGSIEINVLKSCLLSFQMPPPKVIWPPPAPVSRVNRQTPSPNVTGAVLKSDKSASALVFVRETALYGLRGLKEMGEWGDSLKPKEMAMVARGRMEAALLVVVMMLVVGVLGRERCTTDQQRKMQVLSRIYLFADLPPKKSPESSLKKGFTFHR